jgi:hypothetical protein
VNHLWHSFRINRNQAIARTADGAVNAGRNARRSPSNGWYTGPEYDVVAKMYETIKLRPMMTPGKPILGYRDEIYKLDDIGKFCVIVVSRTTKRVSIREADFLVSVPCPRQHESFWKKEK